jgi:hypothetical protein
MLVAYIRGGRKALTLLDSQLRRVAKARAMDVSAGERPARGVCFGLVLRDFPPHPGSGNDRVEHDDVSIAMNVVHVYTHP